MRDKEYSWGDDVNLAHDYANYNGTGGKDKWEFTAPVGSFEPNGYGIFDMPGNVWEWCQDWSDSDKRFKELRGGSWVFSTNILRLDSRICTTRFPATRFNGVGFRCVSGFPAAQQ